MCCGVLQCVAVRCSVTSTAVCCSVLQCNNHYSVLQCDKDETIHHDVEKIAARGISVAVQCVAVCCSVTRLISLTHGVGKIAAHGI